MAERIERPTSTTVASAVAAEAKPDLKKVPELTPSMLIQEVNKLDKWKTLDAFKPHGQRRRYPLRLRPGAKLDASQGF
ncbi:MAG: hypothetical protein WA728_05370 [Xanthobacteraceae bacterium]